jgi:virginiamycin B lyase
MDIRRFLGALFSIAILAGCSQGASLSPRGSAPLVPFDAIRNQSSANVTVRFFNTPTAFSWPDYLTMGSDGNLWFSEFDADQIGRISPSGAIKEFALPANNDIEGITQGADGALWFTEPGANRIGRMTTSGVVTSFPIQADNPSPRGITAGLDGNVWFVEYYGSAIGRITPSGVITQFQIPESESYPWWITTGRDGDLWFTESATNVIGRFNPRKQKFETPIQVPGSFPTPWGIMKAPDGHVWFTERHAGDIAIVFGGVVRSFHIADQTSYPDTIVAGPDGNLWFTENQAAAIGRLNPITGKFLKTIRLPSGDIPTGIAVSRDGNIFFAVANYTQPNSIGEVVLQ